MTESNSIDERDALTRRILEEAPRLREGDEFSFACHPGIGCFNACCGNVNIVLTPFDVVRMSRGLGLTTSEFLARHTFVPFTEDQRIPIVFLQMRDDEKKTCPFVTGQGCSIYESRPWPCRMYPIGQASPSDPGAQGEGFYFLIKEDHCHGHGEKKKWTIGEWVRDQGAAEYDEKGEEFRKILLHPYLMEKPLDPARMEMFYMACYDLDKFRRFVLESKFLSRFKVGPEVVEQIRSDDIEALRFAFRWLRFALFGELTMELNEELLSERDRAALLNRK